MPAWTWELECIDDPPPGAAPDDTCVAFVYSVVAIQLADAGYQRVAKFTMPLGGLVGVYRRGGEYAVVLVEPHSGTDDAGASIIRITIMLTREEPNVFRVVDKSLADNGGELVAETT